MEILIIVILTFWLNIHLAKKKGKSIGWCVFATFIFGIFASIYYLLAKNENKSA
jgi:hypothetical protein